MLTDGDCQTVENVPPVGDRTVILLLAEVDEKGECQR
jgi:hypothetical protein